MPYKNGTFETTGRPVQLETMIEGASFAPVPERPAKAAELPVPDCSVPGLTLTHIFEISAPPSRTVNLGLQG